MKEKETGMVDTWFKQDIEHQLSRGNRAVVLDPNGQCGFLMALLSKFSCTALKKIPGLDAKEEE